MTIPTATLQNTMMATGSEIAPAASQVTDAHNNAHSNAHNNSIGGILTAK